MSSDYLAEPVPLHIPAGVMMSSTRYEPRHRRVEVLCTDRSWRQAEVLAWAKHRAGWAALIRWPDGSQDWRQHDRRFIRPVLRRGGVGRGRCRTVMRAPATPGRGKGPQTRLVQP